jgi:hypothetical protein
MVETYEAHEDGLAEEHCEHERQGGEESRGGAELDVPSVVEGTAHCGGERQCRPERRPQRPVPRGGQVSQIVHAHCEGPPTTTSPGRHGPFHLCHHFRHVRKFGRRVSPQLAMVIRKPLNPDQGGGGPDRGCGGRIE